MLPREPGNSSKIGIGAVLGILAIAYHWLGKRNERVPPGPPRYPVVGNVFNFPMQGWAETFPEWHKKYGTQKYYSLNKDTKPILVPGNLVYANLMGMPVFVIGDREVAEELLNVRGRISASRAPNVLARELCVAFPMSKLVINASCPGWARTSGIWY